VAKLCWRHAEVRVGLSDAGKELALFWRPWRDDSDSISVCEEALFSVEAQLGLALVVVRSGALEAVVREDGPDISIEADRWVACVRCEAEK
jgi:hypothetical protein